MITKTFLLAGNAKFTISVPQQFQTGGMAARYTFRIKRSEPTAQFPKPAWFVSLLTGPDNETSYTYLGKLGEFTGQVVTTQKSRYTQDSNPVRLLNKVLVRVWCDDHQAFEQYGFQIRHEGKCGRCGRTLTVPESIDVGIGPECQEIMGIAS